MRPITATTSTSQSTEPGGRTTVETGPENELTYLVNTTGCSGTSWPDSAAWSR